MSHRLIRAKAALFALALAAICLGTPQSAHAAVVTRNILKTFFQSGDVPTQDQFGTLLDSMINYTDDRYLLGLRSYNPTATYLPGDTLTLRRFGIGDTTPANPLEYVSPSGLTLDMATDFAGQSGFLEIQLSDTAGINTYYGYLQLSMDPVAGAPVPPGPGIHVQYVVFETTPDTALTVQAVPEPATGLTLLMAGAASLLIRRRRRLS